MQPERAPTGSIEELRQVAVEQLALVAYHASLAADQGLVCADAGMAYNSRRAVAHIRFAVDALKMLRERAVRAEAEADERRADYGLNGAARRGEGA